ncbi:MAG: dipeptidase [Anaerolineae bacterium]
MREPEDLERWAELGLRSVGPSWAATRYAGGTYGGSHGLTAEGHALLEIMAGYNLILDLSHLSHQAFYEALDTFEGRIIASHTNPHRFLPGERGFSDEMIAMVAERNGVIGTVFYNRFLKPGWRRGEARVPVDLVVDVIDHICQVTGSAAHVGLGTDFDGDFGVEHAPAEIDTVADVHRLAGPLRERGFSADDIAAVMGGNWLRVLREALPE